MEQKFNPTTLNTIANGTLPELFEREMARVINNIDDLNTAPKSKRSITIELTFEPDATRQSVIVCAKVKSKIIPAREQEAMVFLYRDKRGDLQCVDQRNEQLDLLDKKTGEVRQPPAEGLHVVPPVNKAAE